MNEAIGFAAEIGITVAVLATGGILFGLFLDSRFHIAPFGLLIGAIAGIVIATIVLVVRAMRILK